LAVGLFPESITNKGEEETSKVIPFHHMKAYSGSRGTAPLILKPLLKLEESGILHVQNALPLGIAPVLTA
jgi:hypothetical protein